MTRPFRALLLTSCLWALPAKGAEADLQSWSLFIAQGNASPRLRWYAEVQPRVGGDIQRVERLLLRPAVGFQVNSVVSLWLGYAWTPLVSPEFQDEHRPFQQLLMERPLGSAITLINRTRFEQRAIAGTGGISLRFRHMGRVLVQPLENSPFRIALYNEVFVTLNDVDRGPPSGFDQNRAFAGVNLKTGPVLQVELGYMNNPVRRRAPAETRLNHNVTLMVLANVP
ncbi:MAG TPA: DUF2490 domain-containing protein [Myxococcaceae bacterium]|nr:DUF2490 domain-containing protein [Myxococcaceae bacterium]